MLQAHLPMLVVLVIALVVATLILVLGALLGPKRPSLVKLESFECGNPPSGDARDRFNVKYYLVAILFLVFDIEAVFIYPWAVIFKDSAQGQGAVTAVVAMAELFVFVAIVVVGLAYAWRKGALDWGPEPRHLEPVAQPPQGH